MLSEKQVEDVCLAHTTTADTCRYAFRDGFEWFCAKCNRISKERIDEVIEDFEQDCLKNNVDPYAASMMPLGNNCAGYPFLRLVQQGYDCD